MTGKRAELVADRIVDDVMARGWPVGEVLGAEADLLERYDVSRAVLREAMRLVESQQVGRPRRGPGGGLVITEPTVRPVMEAVVLYLHRVDATLDEVFEARAVIEDVAAALAPGRAGPADRERLRSVAAEHDALVRDPRALHSFVAALTGNPALELFVDVLIQVARLYARGWRAMGDELAGDMGHAHARIAEAIADGDVELARRRMRRHLAAEAEQLRARRSTRQLLPEGTVPDVATGKRASSVARSITLTVVTRDLRPGDLIGSEAELMERYDVSRAVLREAVRLLEHHEVAAMRRGPGGGLFVVPAGPAAVIDIAAIYLARRGTRLADLAELRSAVEPVLAGFAAERADAAAVERIGAAIEREESGVMFVERESVHDLHAAVAAAAGNRALELVMLVLIRLGRLHQVERLADDDRARAAAAVARAHHGIATAIGGHDPDRAAARMRRHLDALGAVMRAEPGRRPVEAADATRGAGPPGRPPSSSCCAAT